MTKTIERICHNCVFNECGDGGYGSHCNMNNEETYATKPCKNGYKTSPFHCRDFRTVEEMRILLNMVNNG